MIQNLWQISATCPLPNSTVSNIFNGYHLDAYYEMLVGREELSKGYIDYKNIREIWSPTALYSTLYVTCRTTRKAQNNNINMMLNGIAEYHCHNINRHSCFTVFLVSVIWYWWTFWNLNFKLQIQNTLLIIRFSCRIFRHQQWSLNSSSVATNNGN